MNENTLDYCVKYIGSSENPEYAILLKGKWGCGKTYFVKKLIEEAIKNYGFVEENFVYISLFGVNNVKQIEGKIFDSIYPIAGSKGAKLGGVALKYAAKIGLNIDIGADENILKKLIVDMINKKITDFNMILIIDDIERSTLNPSELLGYFSEFIIENGVKAIFVGNEDEYNKSNIDSYIKIKEKVIGYTFQIKPDYEESLSMFIKDLTPEVTDGLKIIKKVVKTLNQENLRLIRRAIQGVRYLIQLIPSDYHDEMYLNKIFEVYCVIYFQYNNGSLTHEEISDALTAYYRYNTDIVNYRDQFEKKSKENFSFGFNYEWIPLKDVWEQFIFNTSIDTEQLIKNVTNDIPNFRDVKVSNLHELVRNWINLNSDCFKTLYSDTIREFEEGKYLAIGEILHMYSLLKMFSNYNVIPMTNNNVEDFIQSFLNKWSNKVEAKNEKFSFSMGHFGYAYATDDSDFIEFKKKIMNISYENYVLKVKCEINNFFHTDSFKESELVNFLNKNGVHQYYEFPILSWINIEDFFSNLVEFNYDSQMIFCSILGERYGKSYSNGTLRKEYYEDYDSIVKIKELYSKKNDEMETLYSPQKIQLSYLIEQYNELVIYMDNFITGKTPS